MHKSLEIVFCMNATPSVSLIYALIAAFAYGAKTQIYVISELAIACDSL